MWLRPQEMTEPELVKESERAERRKKAGCWCAKDKELESELLKRAAHTHQEVGLC